VYASALVGVAVAVALCGYLLSRLVRKVCNGVMGVVVVVASDVLRLWVFFYGRRAGFVYLFPNRAAML
jgi:hypothetical protein